MATVALATAGVCNVVEWPDPPDAQTKPAAADLSAGTFVRQDSNGNWVQALATSAANLKGARFLPSTVKSGQPATAFRRGVFSGFTVTQAYGADLFISDTGTLADAAGTTSVVAGRVESATGEPVTSARGKLVAIDLPE